MGSSDVLERLVIDPRAYRRDSGYDGFMVIWTAGLVGLVWAGVRLWMTNGDPTLWIFIGFTGLILLVGLVAFGIGRKPIVLSVTETHVQIGKVGSGAPYQIPKCATIALTLECYDEESVYTLNLLEEHEGYRCSLAHGASNEEKQRLLFDVGAFLERHGVNVSKVDRWRKGK
ncbi:hypothetical protein [Sulfuriroseicoccus oceanibius]|uniref:Uncharacterized protein n=1 Tax=Sulfuriroseicoccus oceanibius TaxID=2707525 RepID=A0A6B3L978_9BACT|nr:hypothetical protein [Sulfuriroseicoccus oceanibius]QQL45478.1 hypothetical protein G3M56_002500 [Sulfuriroseicoccus oceanibius]